MSLSLERVRLALQSLDIDEVKEALLEFGSETDDNKDAIRALAVLTVKDQGSKPVTGLGLRGTDVLLSDIAHRLEDLKIPYLIKKHLDITETQWSAATRILTLIALSLEKSS